jgi:hypothetical protein
LKGATRHAGKGFRNRERLGQETLQAARPLHDSPVLGAELFNAQERDHVLEFAVVLDRAANLGGDLDMLFADDEGIEENRR